MIPVAFGLSVAIAALAQSPAICIEFFRGKRVFYPFLHSVYNIKGNEPLDALCIKFFGGEENGEKADNEKRTIHC